MSACHYCGKPVPVHGAIERRYNTATRVYTRTPNPLAGKPRVSSSMSAIDPTGLFCTLRCAARYGVRAAKAEGRT